jgi:hypothetical protein
MRWVRFWFCVVKKWECNKKQEGKEEERESCKANSGKEGFKGQFVQVLSVDCLY